MSRRFLELVLLLSVSLGLSAWAGEPDIEFKELVYDFGEVEPGEVVTHSYEFRNGGDEELTVSKVAACCGVSARFPTPQVIPPGGTGEIAVTYYARGSEGIRTKRVKVFSNDPDEPRVELTLTGFVKPLLSVTPKGLVFGEVPRGEKARVELKVLPVSAKELKSISVKSSTDWLTTEVVEIVEGGRRGVRVLVTLRPDAPPGELNEELELEVDVGDKKLVKVPVHAKVIGEISGVTFADKSEPDIHFLETVHDFGVVKEGEVITHVYRFGNIGSEELNVSKVSSCCGVKASLLSPSVIPPGGAGEVEVTLRTKRRLGNQAKKVRVHSSDPDEPITELRLTGIVRSIISVTPNRILFGEVPKGEERREKLKVVPTETGVKAITVESSTRYLTTEVVEIVEGGSKEFRVLITLSPDAPPGKLNGRLEIESGVEGYRAVMVPVYALVKGDILVVPERLSFRGVGKGDVISRKLSVARRDEGSLEILKVESDLEFVSVKVSPVEKCRRYEIVLSLKIEDPAKIRNGKVFVYTDHPEERTVEIPLTFYEVR